MGRRIAPGDGADGGSSTIVRGAGVNVIKINVVTIAADNNAVYFSH